MSRRASAALTTIKWLKRRLEFRLRHCRGIERHRSSSPKYCRGWPETDLARRRDRRPSKSYSDGVTIRPIGDFASVYDSARIGLSLNGDGSGKVNLFAPAQDRPLIGSSLQIASAVGVAKSSASSTTDPKSNLILRISLLRCGLCRAILYHGRFRRSNAQQASARPAGGAAGVNGEAFGKCRVRRRGHEKPETEISRL